MGTFALVLAATGSIMVNDMSGGVVTHIGVAAAPGLVVAAMIYTVPDISAAHFSAAVTIGVRSVGRLPTRLMPPASPAQAVPTAQTHLSVYRRHRCRRPKMVAWRPRGLTGGPAGLLLRGVDELME